MSVDDLFDQGSRALDNGDVKEAIRLLSQVVAREPSAESWQMLAEAQIESGHFSKAYKSLDAGLELAPGDIDLLFTLGDLYLEEDKNAEALDTYQKIIDLTPDDIDAWVSKAMAYVNIDDLEAAEQTCLKALEIDPDYAFALNALGDIYANLGRTDDALASFEHASESDPQDPQPCLSLADLYYEREDLELAEKYCLKGLELDAGLPGGYLTLGYICLDQDRTKEAIDHFQQFLRLEQSPGAKQLRDEVAAVIEGLSG